MHRSTTAIAFLAIGAIIAGCTGGGGAIARSVGARSLRAGSKRAGGQRVSRREPRLGGLQPAAPGGRHAHVRVVRWRLPGSAAQGVARAIHRADRRPVHRGRELVERHDQGPGRGRSGDLGRRRRRQRLRARRHKRPARAARLHADPEGRAQRRTSVSPTTGSPTSRTASSSPTTPRSSAPATCPRAGPTTSTRPSSPASAGRGTTPRAACSSSR